MKFSGNTQEIMEGLSITTRALAPKSSKPVLDGVYVQCTDNKLTLTCSDGVFTIMWTGNASVQESGEAIIQGKLFSELMRKLPNTTATIYTDDKAATITCNKSRSRLSVISGEYPHDHGIDNAFTFSIPSITLKDMILHILPAVATEQSRPILTGGLMEISPERITMVALDGFRLAMKHTDMQTDLGGKDLIRSVIPRKTLAELSKILPNTDDPVSVTLNADAITFRIGSATITSTLLIGEYVDYTRIIPNSFKTTIRVNVSHLQESIDRASLMAREGKNNLIRLDIHGSTISVSSRSESGNTEEDLECLQYGDDLSISFNSSYLADAIRNVPSDSATISLNSPSSPAVVSPDAGSDWIYLLLPVRTA